MKLLAIETSTEACSVGLLIDNQIVSDHRMSPQQHGALVLPMIDALMSEAGITSSQLDAVAYGRGPGSFTGVRIGVALTQGIALGADVGVVGISTLHTVAQGVHRLHGDRHIAVSLDARMAEIYFATYSVNDDTGLASPVVQECICTPATVPCIELIQPWVWCGSGAERYAGVLQPQTPGKPVELRQEAWPHAHDLLLLAQSRYQTGEMTSADEAAPVYLRNKVAETIAEREEAKRVRISGKHTALKRM